MSRYYSSVESFTNALLLDTQFCSLQIITLSNKIEACFGRLVQLFLKCVFILFKKHYAQPRYCLNVLEMTIWINENNLQS